MKKGTFAVVQAAEEEVKSDPKYRWDNATRTDGTALVVQRTIGGRGYVEDVDGRHDVPEGFAMLFAHGEETRYGFPPGATEPYRLQFIAFRPTTFVSELFDRVRRDFGSVVRLPEMSEAQALFVDIIKRFHRHTFRDRFEECEYLIRLLIALYREQVENTRASDPIEFGYHLLHNRFRLPINLKLVAEECSISREHFIREFTRRFRESPGAMLRRLRLEHAQSVLRTTGLSIEAVALANGFTSTDTFARAFRRQYGITPAEGRRSG